MVKDNMSYRALKYQGKSVKCKLAMQTDPYIIST